MIFPGALGDLICFTPALRVLACRHSSLELMAREELARFAVGRMAIDRWHSIDRREVSSLFESDRPASQARAFFGAFAQVYSFFASGNDRFREALSQAAGGAVSFHPFRPESEGHVAAGYLRALGLPADPLEYRIEVLAEDREAASRKLGETGLVAGRFALLAPGSGSAGKNWPAAKFAELAERLPVPAAIVLGPAEAHLEPFFTERGLAALNGLKLGELAGIAAAGSLFVGNDSGVSHLCAAVGTAGVAIFGASDPERWRPLGRVKVIRHLPLESLETAEVRDAALQVLAQSADGTPRSRSESTAVPARPESGPKDGSGSV